MARALKLMLIAGYEKDLGGANNLILVDPGPMTVETNRAFRRDLREKAGGVTVGQGAAWNDPRIFLAGYGPQASTIGANRAGRMIARQIMAML